MSVWRAAAAAVASINRCPTFGGPLRAFECPLLRRRPLWRAQRTTHRRCKVSFRLLIVKNYCESRTFSADKSHTCLWMGLKFLQLIADVMLNNFTFGSMSIRRRVSAAGECKVGPTARARHLWRAHLFAILAVQRVTGSDWTQKTFDRASYQLPNGVQLNEICIIMS